MLLSRQTIRSNNFCRFFPASCPILSLPFAASALCKSTSAPTEQNICDAHHKKRKKTIFPLLRTTATCNGLPSREQHAEFTTHGWQFPTFMTQKDTGGSGQTAHKAEPHLRSRRRMGGRRQKPLRTVSRESTTFGKGRKYLSAALQISTANVNRLPLWPDRLR